MSRHKHESDKSEARPDLSARPESVKVPPGADAAGAAPVSGDELDARLAEISAALSAENAASKAELEAAKAESATAKAEADTARAELQDLNEKYLRKLADEVNFRKRMLREKEEAQKYAVAGLLGDIVPILDDFDRAIASAEAAKNYDQLHEGVGLIRKQLSQMLENKYALKRFESKGTLFDPNRHEALFAEPAEVEEPTVAEEFLPGYTLHDRVLRTAKVKVRIPAPRKEGSPASGASN